MRAWAIYAPSGAMICRSAWITEAIAWDDFGAHTKILGYRCVEVEIIEREPGAAVITPPDDAAKQHSGSHPAQEPTEIARLRAGLQWYADHHHYDLEGWEDCSGESANWLFPPTEHSWMVDNGGIARAILDGHEINPDPDADEVTRRPVAAERAT